MSEFALHPRLAADAIFIADWPLSRVLLMNDSRFPWIILVPRRNEAIEIYDLVPADRNSLMDDISRASAALKEVSSATKINVGALGNLVPQLHVHVVARNPGDAAWPGPVWGQGRAVPYDHLTCTELLARLSEKLA